MAYSTQRALSDGTLREVLLTIGFIDRKDINVFLDDLPMTETGAVPSSDITYEWITDNLIRFSEDIPDGSEILIQRSTELGSVLNVFSAGASFDDPTMDENFLQLLYIAQEAREGSSLAEVFQDIDMHGYQLNNLGTATEPGNAVPLHQMQAESTWAYQSRVAAEAAAATAVSARNAAQLSESNAAGSASAAAGSAAAANTSAANAAAAAATAVANRNESQTFRNEAEGFRDEAEGFRDDAENSALEAAGYAAGVNMPSALGHGGEYLRQRVDEGGLEYRTSAQTRADLGLGTAALYNTGQSGNVVPLLNQQNTWSQPQYIAGQSAHPTPLFIERDSSANVSVAFRLGSAGEYTYIGMGPNTPGELYIGTSADLQGSGKKVYHAGNILDVLHPVGSHYIQFAEADGTFSSAKSPATLFGGTWTLKFNTESVFFRTEGALAADGRVGGLQQDAFQGHWHEQWGRLVNNLGSK